MIQLWNMKEEDFQKAVDVIRKGEPAEEFLGNLYFGDLSIDFQLIGEPAVLNFDVYVGGLDTGYGYTEKGKMPYGYADGGCVMDSTNILAFSSFEAFQAITAAKVLEFIGDHNWLLERANVEQISMDWVPERLMKEYPEYFSSTGAYSQKQKPVIKPEVERILEIAKKAQLTSDDLFLEAECVEEYGEWSHLSLMGYSAEDLSEAARVMLEMQRDSIEKDTVSTEEKTLRTQIAGEKTLWARVGMSFSMTNEEYEKFLKREQDGSDLGAYITSLIHEGKARLDGDTYFPEGCNDNPEYEIGMDLSGDLFGDSKLKEQAIEIKDPISVEKHHVLCNLYYQMDNDSMVLGEAELNLKRLKGIDPESISVEIAEARDAESEDFPADKNYWMIASFQVAGEKEAIRKEIEDVMGFMSVDDIEIGPEKEMVKEMESGDVVKNLMDAMAVYAMEAGWSDQDYIDALVECGITKGDFQKYGKGDFVKEYFEEEVDSPSLVEQKGAMPEVMHLLLEEHEDNDGIREFMVLGLSTDETLLKKMMQDRIQEDPYGVIDRNGVQENEDNYFCTEFDGGYVEYSIVEEPVLKAEKQRSLSEQIQGAKKVKQEKQNDASKVAGRDNLER